MNAFLAALRLDGAAISKRELLTPIARLGKRNEWVSCASGAFTATASATATMRPLIAQYEEFYGVGDVRLDNRVELLAFAGLHDAGASDLHIVLGLMHKHGANAVTRIHGDFAFVAWDACAQRLIAARDAFGVKPLFYRRSTQHLLLASRLDPLSGDEQIDKDYVADFLLGLPSPGPHTIWQGTRQLEPGEVLVQRGSVATQARYWSASAFQPQALPEADAVRQFRSLFGEAVAQRTVAGETWSQLSGGLDSSAVVSTAEWQRENRLGPGLIGTITIADSLGTGDERRYSNAVLARYRVRNEAVADYWAWRNDDGLSPPATDEPSPLFPFMAREQRTVDVVTTGGGRILLSGLGADHYMFGTLAYMADMFARRQFRAGAREVLQWSLQTRRSFWHTARLHVVEPIVNNRQRHRALTAPRWLRKDFASAHHALDRLADARGPRARPGELFTTHTATELTRVASWVLRGPFQERLEMRYPFLSRKLVEFTLQLPINMRVRPEGRKWILREAMRGILPEQVRTRQRKGGMDARVLWSLQHEKPLVDALIEDPLLGQLGCVDVAELRRTIDLARQGAWQNTVHVFSILALESWLRARTDNWPNTMARQTAA